MKYELCYVIRLLDQNNNMNYAMFPHYTRKEGFPKNCYTVDNCRSVKEGVVREEQVRRPYTIIMFNLLFFCSRMFNLLYYMLRSRTPVET